MSIDSSQDATMRISTGRPSGIIFDLDGTLIDSVADVATSLNAALRQLGHPGRSESEIRSFMGDSASELVERALPVAAKGQTAQALQVYREYYRAHLLDKSRPFAGVDVLLEQLANSGVRLTIATNKPEAWAKRIAAIRGWSPYFTAIFGGDSLPTAKPAPQIFLAACGALALSPQAVLTVGDGHQDIVGGKAAGTATCGVTWGANSTEVLLQAGADYLIDEPAELLALLGL